MNRTSTPDDIDSATETYGERTVTAIAKREEYSAPALTPMDMLDRAVASGASVETLDKLMALQERWEKNQARKEFDAAVAAAKAELKPVVRNREGHNKKKYADFSAIAAMVDPIISKHGLHYRFRTTQADGIEVTCVLAHRSGHFEESPLAGPPDQSGNKNAIQAIGSTLTYLQRYSLMQALGLAAADDDDGHAPNAGEKISAEQVEKLQLLIVDVGADIPRFLKYLKVADLAELPASRLKEATDALEAKRQA